VNKNVNHAECTQSIVDYIVDKDLTDIVLLGHSFGGTIIVKVAEAISERIRRLIFFNSTMSYHLFNSTMSYHLNLFRLATILPMYQLSSLEFDSSRYFFLSGEKSGIRHSLEQAAQRYGKKLTVLHANPAGLSVYKRIGYQPNAYFKTYACYPIILIQQS
jgi:pimeloyl-ACP methyl ester carboxylesterase